MMSLRHVLVVAFWVGFAAYFLLQLPALLEGLKKENEEKRKKGEKKKSLSRKSIFMLTAYVGMLMGVVLPAYFKVDLPKEQISAFIIGIASMVVIFFCPGKWVNETDWPEK